MAAAKVVQEKNSESLSRTIERCKEVLQNPHGNGADEAVLSALKDLQSLGQLSISTLRETQIGKTVNTLAKVGLTEEVRSKAVLLVSSWKHAVSEQRRGSNCATAAAEDGQVPIIKRSGGAVEQVNPAKKQKAAPREFSSTEADSLRSTSGQATPAEPSSPAAASGSVEAANLTTKSSPGHRDDCGLTAVVYRERLVKQRKYEDTKPGSTSRDGCLKDPPGMPPSAEIYVKREPEPKRDKDGTLCFPDHPEFRPNLTPEQVLRAGAFGGTYFRNITSAVTGVSYTGCDVIKEFPTSWFHGLNVAEQLTSKDYRKAVNKYGVSCGGSLGQWETSGWIAAIDPYGWFQWYCRFYLGRRSSDDARQIDRWLKGQGPKGRWRLQLMNKIISDRRKFDDARTSPVMRQVLLHWAYELTQEDFEVYRMSK